MKGHCIRLEFRVGGDGVRERTWFERVIRLLRDVRVEERLEELGDGFWDPSELTAKNRRIEMTSWSCHGKH